MTFLQSRLGPFPVWVWGVVLIAGVVVFIIVRRMQNGNTTNASGTLGQNTAGQVNPLNPTNDPALDPNTGIPYSIEEMVDPNTGLPYYIELTTGANNPPGSQRSAGIATGPIPPQSGGGPGTQPGTSPSTGPIPPQPGTAPVTVGAQAGRPIGPIPPQPGPRGKRVPPPQPGPDGHHPIPPQPGTAPRGGGGRGPIPPQPGESGEKEPIPPIGTGSEWNYPFWVGQGGLLYTR